MAACITPFFKKATGADIARYGEYIQFPCGRCPECVKRRISGWSFRLRQEGRVRHSAFFLTLTYDDDHLPFSEKGLMTLVKRDVQLFMKRLRNLTKMELKYYAVGEYGGKRNRPHYHMILFNADYKIVTDAWQLGAVHFGDVNGASIGYTLKYISKGKRKYDDPNDDRQPEFSLMSKGLGKNIFLPQ